MRYILSALRDRHIEEALISYQLAGPPFCENLYCANGAPYGRVSWNFGGFRAMLAGLRDSNRHSDARLSGESGTIQRSRGAGIPGRELRAPDSRSERPAAVGATGGVCMSLVILVFSAAKLSTIFAVPGGPSGGARAVSTLPRLWPPTCSSDDWSGVEADDRSTWSLGYSLEVRIG